MINVIEKNFPKPMVLSENTMNYPIKTEIYCSIIGKNHLRAKIMVEYLDMVLNRMKLKEKEIVYEEGDYKEANVKLTCFLKSKFNKNRIKKILSGETLGTKKMELGTENLINVKEIRYERNA